MWVNEVFLDRRLTILFFFAYFVMFYSSWVDPLVFISFLFFWRWFSIVFIVYMVQPKVIMPPWWKDMDFKEKNRVPREKSGRHSNLIYLVLKPLKKTKKKNGTAFGDCSLFSRCCSLFFSDFSLFSRCSIIFHWFFNVVTCVSLFFIDFSVF